MNILAIIGRSRAPELVRFVMPGGAPDWDAALRLLHWRQWARDIEAVMTSLAPPRGDLGLYGRSGGAHLIHQLLTLRPDLQARAYVQAAVNHELDVRWGVNPDPFWREFPAAEPEVARDLLDHVVRHPERRPDLVLILQRQHFFETLADLPAARLGVARAFLDDDAARIAALRSRYQVDAIEQLRNTLEGVGSIVRLHEFMLPHQDPRQRADSIQPDIEAGFHYARPLSDPSPMPRFRARPADWSRLQRQSAEVLQVAGRHDQTCDYRTQIGLNGLTRGSRLLLLNDDHVFKRWTEAGTQPALLQSFFGEGSASTAFARALAGVESLRWREDSVS